MEFVIMGKYAGMPTEEIDTAISTSEATYLLNEYRLAFGPSWRLWIVRRRTE